MIRNLALSLLLLILAVGTVSAQKGWHLGVNGSYNLTTILFPPDYGHATYAGLPYEWNYNKQTTWGYGVGVVGAIQFDEVIGIQMELRYATQGKDFELEYPCAGTSAGCAGYPYSTGRNVEFQYLQTPILLRLTTTGTKAKFYALMGPQVGFILSGKEVIVSRNHTSYGTFTSQREIDLKPHMVKTEVGLLHEIGMDIRLANQVYLNTGVRVYVAVIPIGGFNSSRYYKDDEIRYTYGGSHNAYLGFNMGVKYVFQKKTGVEE